jgi:hypothetical protein
VPPKPQQTSASRISEREPTHAAEQPARLDADAELAQAGAGIVIGRRRLEARVDARNAEDIDQERDELVGLRRERIRARQPVGIAVKELGIVHLEHAGAGAGRRDHVVVRRESVDHLLGNGACRRAVARVEGRLAAARLARHLDDAAGVLQELDGRKADRRPDHVDQAGDEETDAFGRIGHRGSRSGGNLAANLAERARSRKRCTE